MYIVDVFLTFFRNFIFFLFRNRWCNDQNKSIYKSRDKLDLFLLHRLTSSCTRLAEQLRVCFTFLFYDLKETFFLACQQFFFLYLFWIELKSKHSVRRKFRRRIYIIRVLYIYAHRDGDREGRDRERADGWEQEKASCNDLFESIRQEWTHELSCRIFVPISFQYVCFQENSR